MGHPWLLSREMGGRELQMRESDDLGTDDDGLRVGEVFESLGVGGDKLWQAGGLVGSTGRLKWQSARGPAPNGS